MLSRIFKDCFTLADGETYDLGKILWAISVIVFLTLSILDVIHTKTFEYQDFGIGLGTVLAAGGASLAFKSGTEPKPKSKN